MPGYEALRGSGCWSPAASSADVVSKLNAAIVKTLADPEVKKKLSEQGADPYSEKLELNRPGFELTPRSWTNFKGSHGKVRD